MADGGVETSPILVMKATISGNSCHLGLSALWYLTPRPSQAMTARTRTSLQVALLALCHHTAYGLSFADAPGTPAKLNLEAVFTHTLMHFMSWSQMCNDVVRSCGPTKALELKLLDRLSHEKESTSAPLLAEDLLGYVRMIIQLQGKVPSLSQAWKKAPKSATGEITDWTAVGLDSSQVPANAFALADSDSSGGLSEFELIDFMHVCLEIGGANRGLLSNKNFDPWAYGDWAGLNGKEHEDAAVKVWHPLQ